MSDTFKITTNGGVQLGRICALADAQLLILRNFTHRSVYVRHMHDMTTRPWVITISNDRPITASYWGFDQPDRATWPDAFEPLLVAIERATHHQHERVST